MLVEWTRISSKTVEGIYVNLIQSSSNLQCDDKHSYIDTSMHRYLIYTINARIETWCIMMYQCITFIMEIECKEILKLAKVNKSSVMGELIYS